jgi:hypothetical protein
MAIITVLDEVAEEGTAAFAVAFTDTTGAAVTPSANPTWTLTDRAGSVVNSRSTVSVTAASTIYLVLQGSDLDITTYGNTRVLLVEYTFNQTIGGTGYTNLPGKAECRFTVRNLVKVT